MNISKTLQEDIEKKDIIGIHSFFYTIALSDPGFSTGKFEELLNYVKEKNIEGFIEPHDKEEFLDKELWTEEYWSQVASKLQDNFSEERLLHLIEVGKSVYPARQAKAAQTRMTQTGAASKKDSQQRTHSVSSTRTKAQSVPKSEEKAENEKSNLWKKVAVMAGMAILLRRVLRGNK